MTTGFVERLAAARIGDTFNQYAESGLRRERLARYLHERRRTPILLVGEAPGYRGARVSGARFANVGGYLANTFNPGVPFLFYAPLLAVSATLLAVVGKETLER